MIVMYTCIRSYHKWMDVCHINLFINYHIRCLWVVNFFACTKLKIYYFNIVNV